jgi:hypothetical protein
MVMVTVTTSVKVADGPTLPLNATLEPESYTYAAVELDAKGGTNAQHKVPLLPVDGVVVLLAVSAHTASGDPATLTVTATNGSNSKDLTVEGTLVLANGSALAALVTGGPRTVTLKNDGTEAVSAQIITCLDPA